MNWEEVEENCYEIAKEKKSCSVMINDSYLTVISEDEYYNLLTRVAKLDKNLLNEFILAVGSNMVDWDDDTSSIREASKSCDISYDLGCQLVSIHEDVFRGSNVLESALMTPNGWEIYCNLKGVE